MLLTASRAAAAEYHVTPTGDDASPGTADRPFATPERARDAVRASREATPAEPVTVILHGGTYRLAEPLVFTPRDAGTAEAPVIWRSREGEQAIVSGGVPITSWRRHDDRLWVADVPWAKARPEPFTQLFVNGARRPRARTPNEGSYFYTQRLQMEGDLGSFPQCIGFTFREGDLGPWAGGEGATICLFHNWVNSYNRIGRADWDRRRIRFARPAGIFFLGPSVRYYVENAFGALDAPGEWYLDHAAGLLYYYPLPGEDMAKVEAIAPALTATLVELQGDPELGLSVEHLRFQGLSFQHTDADLSSHYVHSVQGANTQRGAIFAVGARDCAIEDCEFTRLGEHAISLRQGCVDNAVTRCHMHDLGGGGVYLSEGGPPTREAWYLTAHNAVDNNFIHDGGRLFRAGCGVFMGGSASYNRVTHNEVCDLSWIGVHVGWSWTGRAPAYTHHNEVAYNHIHHIGNGVLNDLAGIYTLGVSPGTVLHHNLIHDVTRFERGEQGYGGWGIYLDAGSSEIRVENNVVYNTRDGGFHGHCDGHPYGDEVANNVFAYATSAQMMRNNNKEPDGLHVRLERNIVYNANPGMYWGSNWAPESKYAADYNCYWSEETDAPDFSGKTLAEWQATGRDTHSLVADPGFVNAREHDFRLRPDSPALKLGFEPIDLSTVGLYGPEAWIQLPKGIVHRAVETAPPPEPQSVGTIVQDFEEFEPGEAPEGAIPADGPTNVAVTDVEPADGTRCLRLLDGPAKDIWKPHWFVRRTPGAGPVRLRCSVRNDPDQPVVFDLEFRDWPQMAGAGYATGPHLRFQTDGTVQAADGGEWQAIGRYGVGEWLRVEVTLEEGEGKPKTYTVRLGEPGQPTEGLHFRTDAFTNCNWVGFAGMEEDPGVFYVDDLRIE
jgi:hypothetical protein